MLRVSCIFMCWMYAWEYIGPFWKPAHYCIENLEHHLTGWNYYSFITITLLLWDTVDHIYPSFTTMPLVSKETTSSQGTHWKIHSLLIMIKQAAGIYWEFSVPCLVLRTLYAWSHLLWDGWGCSFHHFTHEETSAEMTGNCPWSHN